MSRYFTSFLYNYFLKASSMCVILARVEIWQVKEISYRQCGRLGIPLWIYRFSILHVLFWHHIVFSRPTVQISNPRYFCLLFKKLKSSLGWRLRTEDKIKESVKSQLMMIPKEDFVDLLKKEKKKKERWEKYVFKLE